MERKQRTFAERTANKYKTMGTKKKTVIEWLKDSNRWKHLTGGFLIGLGADDAYCAAYAGIGVASALELKDHLYNEGWDWIDWACTVTGVVIGHLTRYALWQIFQH